MSHLTRAKKISIFLSSALIVTVVLIVAFGFLTFVPGYFSRAPHPRQILSSSESAPGYSSPGVILSGSVPAPALGARPVFPYSIVPGGVESSTDLQNAVSNDPLVARHYADFDVARLRVIPLRRPRSVYVSYRIGNQIFWTNRTLTLPEGEKLITDGAHQARARCGNRISDVRQAPISAREPEPEVLDRAQSPVLFALENVPIGSQLAVATAVPLSPIAPAVVEPPSPLLWWTPFSPPYVPPVSIKPPVGPPPPPPPIFTPEPSAAQQLIIGVFCVGWLLRKAHIA